MSSKNKILLDFNATGNNKVKHLAVHPRKDYIGIVNASNNYSLWNYKESILLKSFSCNSLDEFQQVEIKESLFYDRYSLPTKYEGGMMKNNVIFVTPKRIFLYDYLTDMIKSINQKQLQQKNIRRVAVYSESKICIVLNDGSFKVLDIRGLYSKQQQPEATIRTFKGYHSKPISWIFAYSQNVNQMPRVITVSGSDGLMACWNVDSMLHSGQSAFQASTPCFKFIMNKGHKNDSNNGEQIISLQYDPSSYHLVTLTESYVTIWSTMTGTQLKRVKNSLKLKQIVFFNHFSFGTSSFIGHGHGHQFYIIRNLEHLQVQQEINLKQFVQQPELTILCVKSIPQCPSDLFLLTTTDILVMEIDKFYRPAFGIHPAFLTKLTTFNSRNFIVKGEGEFKRPIQPHQIETMEFPFDILLNTFYLSYDSGWIYFHLIELQFKTMIHQSHKYKLQKLHPNCPFHGQPSRTTVSVSFDGKSIILFNKSLSYFQVYTLDDKAFQSNLIGGDIAQNIDFYTPLILVCSGMCQNIVWHQYTSQFSAICGFDKNQGFVTYAQEKEKKGIFGGGKSKTVVPKQTAQVHSWHACIFKKIKSKDQYTLAMKSVPIKSKLYNLYSIGSQFGYSQEHEGQECLEFISCEKGGSKQVEGSGVAPEKMFVSYCESFQVYCYDGYFIVLRVQQNGSLGYFRSFEQTIVEGLFWEKFFFYATKTGIYFMQILSQAITIRIAHSCPPKDETEKMFQGHIHEDLEAQCHLIPQGQVQIVGVANMHLLVLNQIGREHFLSLKSFPYVEFCIQISSGYLDKAGQLYTNSSHQIQELMKETLSSYGLILSDILN